MNVLLEYILVKATQEKSFAVYQVFLTNALSNGSTFTIQMKQNCKSSPSIWMKCKTFLSLNFGRLWYMQ